MIVIFTLFDTKVNVAAWMVFSHWSCDACASRMSYDGISIRLVSVWKWSHESGSGSTMERN